MEYPYLQRIATFVRLIRELHLAHLAHVTVHVKVLLHGDHAHRLLGALHRRDALTARCALRRENPAMMNFVYYRHKIPTMRTF